MGRSKYKRVLQQVGILWVVIGFIDLLYLAYTVARGTSPSLGWAVAAIAIGILLCSGQLTVANWMRAAVPFFLVSVLGYSLTSVLLRPIALWQVHLRLYPVHTIYFFVINAGLIAALSWTYYRLHHPAILEAYAEAEMKTKFSKPAFAGFIGLIVFLISLTAFSLYGSDAVEAKRLAQQQLGDRYAYYVSGIRWSGNRVSANVIAYSTDEIHYKTVNWKKTN